MSDSNGIVAAYILDGQGGGQQIGWDEINAWHKDQGILWLHLNYSSDDAANWLRENDQLDDVVVNALLSEDPRPRSQTLSTGLLLTLRGVNLNPGADPEDMVSIRIWIGENYIISTRRRKLLSISDLSRDINAGTGPSTIGEFVVRLSDRLVARMSDIVADIDDRVDELEDMVVSEKTYQLRSAISGLRREAIRLRRYLSPQRDAMTRLCNERVSWLSETERVELREVNDDIIRYIEDLDAVREKAIVIQEELMGALSEQMDKRMYVLSMVAALFLPLGFFTGLLGVNVAGIPGAENKSAFAILCLLMGLVVFVQVLVFRKMKWM